MLCTKFGTKRAQPLTLLLDEFLIVVVDAVRLTDERVKPVPGNFAA